jgi:hypothetical protein
MEIGIKGVCRAEKENVSCVPRNRWLVSVYPPGCLSDGGCRRESRLVVVESGLIFSRRNKTNAGSRTGCFLYRVVTASPLRYFGIADRKVTLLPQQQSENQGVEVPLHNHILDRCHCLLQKIGIRCVR